MDGIEINFGDDKSLSLEDLLKLPISDFYDGNQPFGDPFFQNSDVSSNIASNQAYSPSLDATKEEQQTPVGDLKGFLGEKTSNLSRDEPIKHEQIPNMATPTNIIIENDDYTIEDLFELAETMSPHPQQNIMKSIYNDNEPFFPSMPPTIFTGYPNMNTCLGGLYQGRMGLSMYDVGQGQTLFSDGTLPMTMPSSNLMPTMMSMPVLNTPYQNNAMRLYNMQGTFHQYGYKPTNLQVLQNRQPQQQRSNNNFSPAVCDGITSLYACQKTLADSRPRVRGRFAKNDQTEEMARASTSNQDCNNVGAGINNGVLFKYFDFLDRSNYNNSLEDPGFDPLDFLSLDG